MKRIFLALSLFVASTSICTAQKNDFQLAVGPVVGITTGDFSATHSFGIGLDVTGEYKFDPSLAGTIASGFIVYSGKSAGAGIKFKAVTIIPVKAGIRYYFGSSFYGAGELGLGIISGSGSTSAFGYSLGLGSKINTGGGKKFDVGVKYDAYSKSGTLGAIVFRVAFVI